MDFQTLKEQARKEWAAQEQLTLPLIQIGMGTCGLAAGAETVLEACRHALSRMNLLARIVPVGCIGLCYLEPLLSIRKPGRPAVLYGPLSDKKVPELFSAYR